jgi:hypothetical protein
MNELVLWNQAQHDDLSPSLAQRWNGDWQKTLYVPVNRCMLDQYDAIN